MRRNSGGFVHSDDALKCKLGIAVCSLENGKWRTAARQYDDAFNSMPSSNLVSRPLHEEYSVKHNFIDKSPISLRRNPSERSATSRNDSKACRNVPESAGTTPRPAGTYQKPVVRNPHEPQRETVTYPPRCALSDGGANFGGKNEGSPVSVRP